MQRAAAAEPVQDDALREIAECVEAMRNFAYSYKRSIHRKACDIADRTERAATRLRTVPSEPDALTVERRRWMVALAEAVHYGQLSVSLESEVLAHVNGYVEDDINQSILDDAFYYDCRRRLEKPWPPEAQRTVPAVPSDVQALCVGCSHPPHASGNCPRIIGREMYQEPCECLLDFSARTERGAQ